MHSQYADLEQRHDRVASPLRIVLTLLGILAAVALIGGGIFALANLIAGPAQPAPIEMASPSASAEPPAQAVEPQISTAEIAASEPPPTAAAAGAAGGSAAEPTSAEKTPTEASPAPSAEPVDPVSVAPATAAAANRRYVVVIDAGHQARGNNKPEPIGPGAKTKKPSVTSGAAGVSTHQLESAVNLKVAKRLRALLEARGVKVIMVRTSQNVNIPNSKRAQIANAAGADLLIRLHCDSVGNRTTRGLLTLVPAKNRWTGPIVAPSRRAGRAIHSATLASTGAKNRGITGRTDMSGFNWSKVPAVIVEMGVLSNPADDRKLATSAYQQKLANGIADGIMNYLSGK